MNCPRCGSAIPDGANFCMRCGTPIQRVEARPTFAPPGAVMVPTGAKRPTNMWPIAALLLGIGLLFLIGMVASGALQNRSDQGPLTLAQQRQPGPPTLEQTAEAPPQMPPEVRDWLEHLRRIEERKNKLNAQEVAQLKVFTAKFEALGPAAGLLNENGDDEGHTNPEIPVKDQIQDLEGPWKQLIKDFQSVPPPEECQPLADEYYAGLNEIPAMMNDIQSIINSISNPTGTTGDAQSALNKAYSTQGTSAGSIDSHFAASDEMLSQVCDKYSTKKWFGIATDLGGGMLGRSSF